MQRTERCLHNFDTQLPFIPCCTATANRPPAFAPGPTFTFNFVINFCGSSPGWSGRVVPLSSTPSREENPYVFRFSVSGQHMMFTGFPSPCFTNVSCALSGAGRLAGLKTFPIEPSSPPDYTSLSVSISLSHTHKPFS